MKRIRITLIEKKRGWTYVLQEWDTSVGRGFYGDKTEEKSTRLFASPTDILDLLAIKEDNQ